MLLTNSKSYSIYRCIYLLMIFTLANSCSRRVKDIVYIDSVDYYSVKHFGAKGDNKADDTKFIQEAFNKAENIYFPKGNYLINSLFRGEHNYQSLIITNKTKVRKILFDKDAQLIVGSNFNLSGVKNTIIKIYTESEGIDTLIIDGLNILANDLIQQNNNTGVFAIENKGYHIDYLQLDNSKLYNLTGAGILTYASNTVLRNTYTENTGSHGIGALNPYNLGSEHFLSIDGYFSNKDRAYSIDFSGTSDYSDVSKANPLDIWKGVVKNVKSFSSERGIKTAGYWDLYLENIEIVNPKYYGFFINKDAPGKEIHFKDLSIIGAGECGLSLSGKTLFKGNNLTVKECTQGIITVGAEIQIKGLVIIGSNMKRGLRFQNNGIIDSFFISGVSEEYAPVWVSGENCVLRNGTIFTGSCMYGMLIHEKSNNTQIENVRILDNEKRSYDYLILQKAGRLRILNDKSTHREDYQHRVNNLSGIKVDFR